jgi:hypothetical protein
MPTDVLDRISSEIDERLRVLTGAVVEAKGLEKALSALNDPVELVGSPSKNGHQPALTRGKQNGSKRPRKPGVYDAAVLQALEGETEGCDIVSISDKTGLTITIVGKTLHKLHEDGVLKRRKGHYPRPKAMSKSIWSLKV